MMDGFYLLLDDTVTSKKGHSMTRNISFTTVMYRNPEKVLEMIDSLSNILSNCDNYNIYVVNNDEIKSEKFFSSKLRTYKNTHLIEAESNRGFGAGNNLILSRIVSTYHIVINPDVQIHNINEIEKMINFMDDHEDVDLLSPKILNVDGTIQKLYKYNPTVLDLLIRFISSNVLKKRQAWYVHDGNYEEIGPIDHASGAFMFFRTSSFVSIGGFDERYFMYMEDADITRKVNSVGKAIFYPDAYVTHEWQRDSHKNIKGMMMMIFSMSKYFNKWGWRLW